MPSSRKVNTRRRLAALAHDPEAQAALALSLLQPRQKVDVLLAVLPVLAENPADDAREPLLALYAYLAANGVKRDPGAQLRSGVLSAMRPLCTGHDLDLLLKAVETYEFLPPTFGEEASPLRASALAILDDLDEELASFHAARLLVDEHVAEMSAEPALTAARVLAGRANIVPLYLYVSQPAQCHRAEVAAECLRNLTTLPVPLLVSLADRVRKRAEPLELLGLFDLLLNHEAGPQRLSFLESYLRSPGDADLYRYLLISMLLTRNKALLRIIGEVALQEDDRHRRDIMRELLPPYKSDESISAALEQLASVIEGG